MKKFRLTFQKQASLCLLVFSIVLMTTVLSSCSKNDDDDNNTPGVASVMVVNSAQGSAAQDLYLDNSKVNTDAVAYNQSSSYANVSSGTRNAEFRTAGSATVNSSSSISLQSGRYYTLYYTGGTASSAAYATEDDRSSPSSGKVKVRFVNLSTASASANSSLDIIITGGVKVVNTLAYKATSAYAEFDPSVATSFQATAAGNSTSLITLASLGFQAGKNYTIVISGTTTATLTYKVLTNN